MQAGHRRVLVGHPAQPARRARPLPPPAVRAVLRHRVDEAVARVQQAGRAGRHQREADQAQQRGVHQPDAGRPVQRRPAPEHPYEDGRGDRVVQGGVREVGGYAEGGGAGEETVQRVLGVEVQRLFEPEDRQAVVDRGRHVAADQEPAHRVQRVDHRDQRQLGPPAGPMTGRGLRVGGRRDGVRHPVALPKVRAADGERSTVRWPRAPVPAGAPFPDAPCRSTPAGAGRTAGGCAGRDAGRAREVACPLRTG